MKQTATKRNLPIQKDKQRNLLHKTGTKYKNCLLSAVLGSSLRTKLFNIVVFFVPWPVLFLLVFFSCFIRNHGRYILVFRSYYSKSPWLLGQPWIPRSSGLSSQLCLLHLSAVSFQKSKILFFFNSTKTYLPTLSGPRLPVWAYFLCPLLLT